MKIERIIELLKIERECVLRNAHDECDRDCANCDIVQDDGELIDMYNDAIFILKELKEKDTVKECKMCSNPLEKGWNWCPWCRAEVRRMYKPTPNSYMDEFDTTWR